MKRSASAARLDEVDDVIIIDDEPEYGHFASAADVQRIKTYLNTVPVPQLREYDGQYCDCELRGYETWKAWVEMGMPYVTPHNRYNPMEACPYARYVCGLCRSDYE